MSIDDCSVSSGQVKTPMAVGYHSSPATAADLLFVGGARDWEPARPRVDSLASVPSMKISLHKDTQDFRQVSRVLVVFA